MMKKLLLVALVLMAGVAHAGPPAGFFATAVDSSTDLITNSITTNVLDVAETAGVINKAGYGRFWVNSTDGRPYFRNSSGADVDLSPDGGTTTSVAGWELSVAFYDFKNVSAAAQGAATRNIEMNADGTAVYTVESTNDKVHQYTLLTPYDVSTAVYSLKNVSVGGLETTPTDMVFNSTGFGMYVVGWDNDKVHQFDLATAYDVSTATYSLKNVSVAGQDAQPHGVAFDATGDTMFIVGDTGDNAYQYALGTSWDVSTAVYSNKSLNVGAQSNNPKGIAFNSTGTKMLIYGSANGVVYQYKLDPAYDLADAVYANISKSVLLETTAGAGSGVVFSNSGKIMLTLGGGVIIYQYTSNFAYSTD